MTLTVAANQNIKYYTIVDIGTYLHEFPNQEFNWQTAMDIINSKFNDYYVNCGYYVNDLEEWKCNLTEQEFSNLQFVPVNESDDPREMGQLFELIKIN